MSKYQKSLDSLFIFATLDSNGEQSVNSYTFKSLEEDKSNIEKIIYVYTFLEVIYDEYVVNKNNDELTDGAKELANALSIIEKELNLHLDISLKSDSSDWSKDETT